MLKSFADNNPAFRQMLLRKAELYARKRKIISDENEFVQLLNSVDLMLVEVEKQLEKNGKSLETLEMTKSIF